MIDSYAILNCPIEKLQLEIMFISIPILILEEKVTISENCAIGSGSRLFTEV